MSFVIVRLLYTKKSRNLVLVSLSLASVFVLMLASLSVGKLLRVTLQYA